MRPFSDNSAVCDSLRSQAECVERVEAGRREDAMNVPHGVRSLPLKELIRACASSTDQENWEELIRRVHPVIAATIIRVTSRSKETSPSVADDLIQETY